MITEERVHTGVPGLDEILGGGLPATGLYLLRGDPGTGKTTMGLRFLVEGARRGEKCLYLCLAETRGQLTGIAKAYGWTLDGVEVHEMRRRGGRADEADGGGYTVFSPSEVELEEISRELLDQLERVEPTRLVLKRMAAQTTPAAGKAGLGLGLFIAREIARAHGGDVSVQSSDERTTFEVTLPRNARSADAAALTTT